MLNPIAEMDVTLLRDARQDFFRRQALVRLARSSAPAHRSPLCRLASRLPAVCHRRGGREI
jgi:hypothetical protein